MAPEVVAGRERVVVVDDDAGWRLLIGMLLRRCEAFELVGEAASGEDGIQVVQETDPDVVVLDVRMPGIDGLTALRMLRDRHPRVRVVMCSAEDHYRVPAVAAGADGWVTKSDGTRALLDAMRTAHSPRRSVRAPRSAP